MVDPAHENEQLILKPAAFQQRVADCRTLYLAYQGRHHKEIQAEMRALGYERWNRRCLYADGDKPGWPERFGWRNPNRSSESLESKGSANSTNSRNSPNSHNSTNSPNSPNSTNSFAAFLRRVSPGMTWDARFQRHLIKKLEDFAAGKFRRLMIFMPPRHGKSELVTVRFSAWLLAHAPKTNIIIGSYGQRLANRFSRKIRNVLAQHDALRSVNAPDAPPLHDKSTCPSCIARASRCPNDNDKALASPNADDADNADSYLSASSASSAVNAAGQSSSRLRRVRTDAEWETAEGGGVRAVGAGAGITGFGADLIIVDDPVKSRAEAESATIRERVHEWFNDDLYTRLEPTGQVILIQTRWHEDDLAGRLRREMADDPEGPQWEIIELPAFAEPPREPVKDETEAPWPVHVREQPERKKPIYYIRNGQAVRIRGLGERIDGSDPSPSLPGTQASRVPSRRIGSTALPGAQASRLHQRGTDSTLEQAGRLRSGRVVPPGTHASRVPFCSSEWRDCLGRREGEVLWPERFDEKRLQENRRRLGSYSFAALYQQQPVPAEGGFFKRHWFRIADFPPPNLKWKRGYDLGISTAQTADYTATARVAFDPSGNLYIDRVLRRRMEYPEQRRAILALIADEPDTEHFIEASANGNAVIQDLRREPRLAMRRFRGVKVTESKTARAFTWNALAEEGRVFLVRGAWNTDFIDEACSFPSGHHDDQIDAVSIAVKMAQEQKSKTYVF